MYNLPQSRERKIPGRNSGPAYPEIFITVLRKSIALTIGDFTLMTVPQSAILIIR